MLRYTLIEFFTKRKKDYCKLGFNQIETTGKGLDHYNALYTKISDQPISKAIDDCKMRMEAHLMFASELVDNTINLDENMDYEKYFKEFQHQQDQRFEGVDVTKIEFIPNKDGELHGVKIYGKKVTQYTDKPYTNKISTPVIQLNKETDNYYKLVVILDEQVHELLKAIDEHQEKAQAKKDAQLKIA